MRGCTWGEDLGYIWVIVIGSHGLGFASEYYCNSFQVKFVHCD